MHDRWCVPIHPHISTLFSLLGPDYILASSVVAIAFALFTETFGFTLGFVGYYRRKLIDFAQSPTFLSISIPSAIAGAMLSHYMDPVLIWCSYGMLMLILSVILLRGHEVPLEEVYGEEMYTDDEGYIGSEINLARPCSTALQPGTH